MKIYRTIQWGQLANFHMMDTRQYRDGQLAGDCWKKNVIYNDSRGYVNTKIKDAMTADFRVLDYVTTPGSPSAFHLPRRARIVPMVRRGVGVTA